MRGAETPLPFRSADRRLLRWTGAAALALFAGIALYLAPLYPDVLELQLAWTPRRFGEVVHGWTPDQLARYRAHLALDVLLLIAYGAFGWLLVTRTAVVASAGMRLRAVARWMLPAAAVFDAAENLLHAWLTAAPRFGLAGLYAVSAGCSALKWLLLLAFGVLVAWALIRERESAAGG